MRNGNMLTLVRQPTTVRSSNEVATPYLRLDLDQVRANVLALRAAFAALEPTLYYAVKANPDPRVLALVHALGCGFDVASIGEIRKLQTLGVPGSSITFSAPVKIPTHVEEAVSRGVKRFAFDSASEVRKLSALAPGAQVVLRLEVPHEGSAWPLAGKFGVPQAEAPALLKLARDAGLQPYGLTFHVGSQCLRPESWVDAIRICQQVWAGAAQSGIHLRLINLGGGLPARYTEDVPSGALIGEVASRTALAAFGSDVEYAFEPGRSLVANAGSLVTSVIGTAERNGKRWVYVDQSIYAGLLEVIGGWTYSIRTPRDGAPRQSVTLAGPSCDSTDILAENVELPELEVGDRLELLTAGAYTTSYDRYNGLDFPAVMYTSGNAVATEWRQAA
jgi:ornithine decarboxylase